MSCPPLEEEVQSQRGVDLEKTIDLFLKIVPSDIQSRVPIMTLIKAKDIFITPDKYKQHKQRGNLSFDLKLNHLGFF